MDPPSKLQIHDPTRQNTDKKPNLKILNGLIKIGNTYIKQNQFCFPFPNNIKIIKLWNTSITISNFKNL